MAYYLTGGQKLSKEFYFSDKNCPIRRWNKMGSFKADTVAILLSTRLNFEFVKSNGHYLHYTDADVAFYVTKSRLAAKYKVAKSRPCCSYNA